MVDLMDEERFPAFAVDELGNRVMRVRGHRPQGLAARLCRIPYAGELIDYIILHYYGFRYRGEILRALEGSEFDAIYFYFLRHREGAIWIGTERSYDFPKPRGMIGRAEVSDAPARPLEIRLNT